jgi:hypothetical protein
MLRARDLAFPVVHDAVGIVCLIYFQYCSLFEVGDIKVSSRRLFRRASDQKAST